MSGNVQPVEAERVELTHTQTFVAVVSLVDRPDYVDSAGVLGKKGLTYAPDSLRVEWVKVNADPWTLVQAKQIMRLRLKSGQLSAEITRAAGLTGKDGRRDYGWCYPFVETPDYVGGMVDAYAPEGWQP